MTTESASAAPVGAPGIPALPQPRPPEGARVVWGAVGLDDPAATAAVLAGSKAARLAQARAAGLPVLAGWVLPVPLVARRGTADGEAAVRRVWAAVRDERPVLVRSSSPDEDGRTASHAGCYTTVAGVDSWERFRDAVDEVALSGRDGPMAVLVQRQLRPLVGGVLFGVDPVDGGRRPLLAAVAGSPAPLVSGEVEGELFVLDRRGARRDDGTRARAVLGLPARRLSVQLRSLLARCAELFGGPQDLEWAVDGDGTLWLLQSRPVTRVAAEVAPGARLLGPGPVAETLPAPLWPLEQDLWVPPLDAGVCAALAAVGAPVPADGVVRVVHSRAVADLVALGAADERRRWLAVLLDPRPGLRRASRAWRAARLAAAWPALAGDLVRHLDRLLHGVPDLGRLDDAHLLGMLRTTGQALVAAHGYEALAGVVAVPASERAPTASGAAAALSVLAEVDDDADSAELVARHPVLLALAAPSLAPVRLPTAPAGRLHEQVPADPGDPALLREALRLRARWLQELQAQVVRELGRRLRERGQTSRAADVRELRLEELDALVADRSRRHVPDPTRRPRSVEVPGAFRLDRDGDPVAESDGPAAGRGAGGGRRAGVVVHRGDARPAGVPAVLVVDVLDPALAAELPGLAGLVCETGNPLSHLAIVAREHGVATVVGVAGARGALPRGLRVVVDGRAGTVAPDGAGP